MKLNELFTDDDAVSPVIGVILMVAITVILAAVIAGTVMGLGQDKTSTTPTASFDFATSENGTNFDVTATHDGGDALETANIDVKATDGTAYDPTQNNLTSGDSWTAATNVPSGETVSVVWQHPDTDKSATLGQFEV